MVRVRPRTTNTRAKASRSPRKPQGTASRARKPKLVDDEVVNRQLRRLARAYPQPQCELVHHSPFELLIATILSAQCTDVTVNKVTPMLFSRYPDANALALADPAQVETIVRPTGFFRVKAKNIVACARMLCERHGCKVPRTMPELLELPGVARKTANVVLGTAFGIAEGVVVDTHVLRNAARLGIAREDNPVKMEQALMTRIPRNRWIDFSHQLILHGRRICFARKPACDRCPLAPDCPSAEVG